MADIKVLATVNGKQITERDMVRLLESMGQQRAMQFYNEKGRKQLLDELINQELLYLDAVEQDMDQDEVFTQQLEATKANMLKQYALHKLLGGVTVSDEEVAAYYKENRAQFFSDESVKASHILVADEQKAAEVVAEIQGGLSFAEAAQKYSSCPSKEQGGDLGFFTAGKMVPEFEKAAFAMEVGQISEPVKTQFGYHIIQVTDKKEPGIQSLDQVKDRLKQELTKAKQNYVYANKANQLKAKYEVQITE